MFTSQSRVLRCSYLYRRTHTCSHRSAVCFLKTRWKAQPTKSLLPSDLTASLDSTLDLRVSDLGSAKRWGEKNCSSAKLCNLDFHLKCLEHLNPLNTPRASVPSLQIKELIKKTEQRGEKQQYGGPGGFSGQNAAVNKKEQAWYEHSDKLGMLELAACVYPTS